MGGGGRREEMEDKGEGDGWRRERREGEGGKITEMGERRGGKGEEGGQNAITYVCTIYV